MLQRVSHQDAINRTTTKEQYPEDVKFELTMDKTDLIDPYNACDALKVHFNNRGNEYNGKHFVNLQAWRLEPLEGATSSNSHGIPAKGGSIWRCL